MMRAVACDPATVAALLGAVKSRKVDRAGRYDLQSLIARGRPFAIVAPGGEIVGAYVLETIGSTLWVLAAGGRAVFDLAAAMFALLDVQGQAFDAIGFRTERRGLVRKAARAGYCVTGRAGPAYLLRKEKP